MESAVSRVQPWSQEGRESYPASRGSCPVSYLLNSGVGIWNISGISGGLFWGSQDRAGTNCPWWCRQNA